MTQTESFVILRPGNREKSAEQLSNCVKELQLRADFDDKNKHATFIYVLLFHKVPKIAGNRHFCQASCVSLNMDAHI